MQYIITLLWNYSGMLVAHCYYYVTDSNYRMARELASYKPRSWSLAKSFQLRDLFYEYEIDELFWGEGKGVLGTDIVILKSRNGYYSVSICGCCPSLGCPEPVVKS
jgi:hypothetical protein